VSDCCLTQNGQFPPVRTCYITITWE